MVRRSRKKATTNNYRCEFKNLKFKSKRRIAVVSRKARKDGEEQVSVRFTFGFLADVCEESWSLAHLREDSRTHRDNEKREREGEREGSDRNEKGTAEAAWLFWWCTNVNVAKIDGRL